jgi:hypothetical protein
MKPKQINYVFGVGFLSCSGSGEWIERRTVKQSNECKTPIVALAGNIAAHYLDATESGVRVRFLGLQEEGSTEITPMNTFELTVLRT